MHDWISFFQEERDGKETSLVKFTYDATRSGILFVYGGPQESLDKEGKSRYSEFLFQGQR